MDEEIDINVLTVFQRDPSIPHKGLARIAATLEVIGIPMVMRKWRSKGDEHFPRVQYMGHSPYTLSMGVSRELSRGHTSWIAIQAVDEHHDSSSIIRLHFREAERMWLRSWSVGMVPDQLIDHLIREWFPHNEPEIRLENDDLINLTLQHFVILLNGE